MSEMQVPTWIEDMKSQAAEEGFDLSEEKMVMGENTGVAKFGTKNLTRIDNYSTFFAEFEVKDGDILMHFFPRDGAEDVWEDGHYTNRCKSCGREVEMPKTLPELKPCPGCGHTGLRYIPGRVEEKAKVTFPDNIDSILKAAVDEVWLGDAAVELIDELGAYVVQFQAAKDTAGVVGAPRFAEKMCDALDVLLDA